MHRIWRTNVQYIIYIYIHIVYSLTQIHVCRSTDYIWQWWFTDIHQSYCFRSCWEDSPHADTCRQLFWPKAVWGRYSSNKATVSRMYPSTPKLKALIRSRDSLNQPWNCLLPSHLPLETRTETSPLLMKYISSATWKTYPPEHLPLNLRCASWVTTNVLLDVSTKINEFAKWGD